MSTTPTASADRPVAIAHLATAYAENPAPETLDRLRIAVRRSPSYRADLDVVRTAVPLLARGAHAEVVEAVGGLMPGAFLSPMAHSVLATAYDGLGDAARARRERSLAQLAMSSILSSGDGSRERPWAVLRVSDEYDVLHAQQRTSRTQRTVTRHGRRLDQHRCADGTEAWFDIDLLDRRE